MDGKVIKDQLVQTIVRVDIREFTKILSTVNDLTAIKDKTNCTLMHEIMLCVVSEDRLLQILGILIEAYKERYQAQWSEMVKAYANLAMEEDRRTALHYAVQNGRGKLVEKLIELGADWESRDVNGDNVLHIAASKGMIWLVVYFHISLNMDINQADFKGRTPLHIASLERQEHVASLLIAWSTNLDVQDNEQLTPLHLATVSSSYRIVKHLLMAGASRNMSDVQGTTPRDLAYIKSADDLVGMLTEPGCCDGINPIKSPLRPAKNSYSHYILFHFLFIARYALVFLFILPGVDFEFICASVLLFSLSFIFFEISSCTNPGYVKKNPEKNYLSLYEKYIPDYVCPYCEVKRKGATRHCQHCNRCVRKFDHHCPWIHNCIGEKNQKVFTFFLLVTVLDFGYHCALGVLDALKMLPHHTSVSYPEVIPHEPSKMAMGLATAGLCGVCVLPVLPLIYVQLGNLCMGQTTHQRFAHRRTTEAPDTSSTIDRSSLLSERSDRNSMLVANSENDWGFFSGTSLIAGAIDRGKIKIYTEKKCCGLYTTREVEIENDNHEMVIENME